MLSQTPLNGEQNLQKTKKTGHGTSISGRDGPSKLHNIHRTTLRDDLPSSIPNSIALEQGSETQVESEKEELFQI